MFAGCSARKQTDTQMASGMRLVTPAAMGAAAALTRVTYGGGRDKRMRWTR